MLTSLLRLQFDCKKKQWEYDCSAPSDTHEGVDSKFRVDSVLLYFSVFAPAEAVAKWRRKLFALAVKTVHDKAITEVNIYASHKVKLDRLAKIQGKKQ